MIIPNDWGDIAPKEFSTFRPLTLGGHKCRIVDVKEYVSDYTGKQTLKVMFDIAEDGEYDGYCQKIFDGSQLLCKRWPNEGTKYFPLKETQLGYLKKFIDVLELSNDVKFDVKPNTPFDFNQFVGLEFAGQFGLKQFKSKETDQVKTGLSLFSFKPTQMLDTIEIPKVILINGTEMEYDDFIKSDPCGDNQNMRQEKLVFDENSVTSVSDEISF